MESFIKLFGNLLAFVYHCLVRSSAARFPVKDPDYRIIGRQRCRCTHYHFYIRDEVLGPMSMCVGSFGRRAWRLAQDGPPHQMIEGLVRRFLPFQLSPIRRVKG
jgi:hypothetical protein